LTETTTSVGFSPAEDDAFGEDVPDGVPSLLPAHPDSRSKAPVARHAVHRSALV